jgi:small multidrug resistance family-3 protein
MNTTLIRSIFFFVLAGLMEIGGGYLMWLCLRERWAWWVGALGALLLVTYGVVPTYQPANFGRVYAAYGGVFVLMSMLWGWWIDGHRPDTWDVTGAALCVVGVGLIMYAPRGATP